MEICEESHRADTSQELDFSFAQHKKEDFLSTDNIYGSDISSHSGFHRDSGLGSSCTSVTANITHNLSSNFNIFPSTPIKSFESSKIFSSSAKLNILEQNKLTPVTQNIHGISNFHITTPKSNLELSNSIINANKRNLSSCLGLDCYQNTPKKAKLEADFTCSSPKPEKSCSSEKNNIQRSRRSRRLSKSSKKFLTRLDSAPELDSYLQYKENKHNSENLFSPRRAAEISPIIKKRDSPYEKRTPLSNKSINSVEASTPKSNDIKRSPVSTNVSKSSSVKKLLTFSDKQFGELLKSGATECVDLLKPKTPLKQEQNEMILNENKNRNMRKSAQNKRLSRTFSSIFEDRETAKRRANIERLSSLKTDLKDDLKRPSLFQQNASSTATKSSHLPNIPAEEDEKIEFLGNETKLMKQLKEETAGDINKNISEPEKEKSFEMKTMELNAPRLEILKTPTKLKIMKVSHERIETKIKRDNEKAFDNNEFRRKLFEESPEMISNEERVGFNYCLPPPDIQKTPPRTTCSNADLEYAGILHPEIPRTPSKRTNLRPNKKKQTPGKHRRKFYNGITRLNILVKLENYSIVLEKVFSYLSSKDLLNLTRVSKNLERIVKSNQKANLRLSSHLLEIERTKENIGDNITRNKNLIRRDDTGSQKRVPLKLSNVNFERKKSLDTPKSPQVSPSRRKFYENQKVVKTLGDNEKLVKCPRCAKSSRIFNTPPVNNNDVFNTNINSYKRNSLTRAYLPSLEYLNSLTFQSQSTFSSGENTEEFCNNNNNNRNTTSSLSDKTNSLENTSQSNLLSRYQNLSGTQKNKRMMKSFSLDSTKSLDSEPESTTFQSYAECSGLGCKFQFCLECYCEYHPGEACKLTKSISPRKEEIQDGILELPPGLSSRILKGRRKSLKRLCF